MRAYPPFVFAALPLLACGGVAGSSTPPPDAGGGAIHQEAGTTTIISHGDSGTTTSGIVDGGSLVVQAFGGGPGEVAAQVPLTEPGVGEEQTCAPPVSAGACQLLSCQLGGIGDPGGGYGNYGTISATADGTTEPIAYNGIGYPSVYFPSSVTLNEGDTMTFKGGNGGSIPSFDVTATIPGRGVITSPVPTTDGGTAAIDTSKDLAVSWQPISIGQIHFSFSGGGEAPGSVAVSVNCTFPGASGSGVVPQALLSSLKEMSSGASVYAGLSSELDVTTVVNGLTVVTQSFQNSAADSQSFNVKLE